MYLGGMVVLMCLLFFLLLLCVFWVDVLWRVLVLVFWVLLLFLFCFLFVDIFGWGLFIEFEVFFFEVCFLGFLVWVVVVVDLGVVVVFFFVVVFVVGVVVFVVGCFLIDMCFLLGSLEIIFLVLWILFGWLGFEILLWVGSFFCVWFVIYVLYLSIGNFLLILLMVINFFLCWWWCGWGMFFMLIGLLFLFICIWWLWVLYLK